MTEIIDMSQFTEARSDQLNSDDLLGGPRTVTITRVAGSEGDQPIAIHYAGDNGKPFKPCKTIRRVLMGVWGRYANEYVGRSMTLYRDDTVSFGGLQVGGIRISHMSHIDKDTIVVVNKSKGKKFAFKVEPLRAQQQRQQPTGYDPGTLATLDALRIGAAAGMAHLESDWKALTPETRKALKNELPALKKIAEEADAADDFNSPASPAPGAPTAEAGSSIETEEVAASVSEGPDDSQRGDGDADREAREFVTSYIDSVKNAKNPDELAAAYKAGDSGAARIRSEFPELYPEIDPYRPADAPERG